MPPPQHQSHRMFLPPPPPPPPSPGMLQSKPAEARGKIGVSKSDSEQPLSKPKPKPKQQHPSNVSKSDQCPGSRRALRAVENTIYGSNNHLSSSSSSSSSIEAPKGCLRLLLSQCSSSSSSSSAAAITHSTRKAAFNRRCRTRTPKSGHVLRLPHSENALSDSVSNVKKSHSSKTSTSSKAPAVCDPVFQSHSVSGHSGDLLKQSEELRFTPMAATKNAVYSKLDHLIDGNGNSKNRLVDDEKSNTSSSNTKTPPLQASFSPEIQSAATMTKTPACYAAGHLISGVTDKRKCRARGVLAVAQSGPNDEKSNTKTPPLQASFSPEVQSTATMATTPACYSAGHLISGVTDKRKCRARGLLAVAQSGPTDNDDSKNVGFEQDNETGFNNKFPSPAEASMHWLLSPCHETDENHNENSASPHGLLGGLSPSSPLADLGFSFDWCNFSNDKSDATNSGTGKSTNSMLISTQGLQFRLRSVCAPLVSSSPDVTPYSRAVPPKKEEKRCYDIDRRNSPLSADTLGSENVMQTPNSDSSLERPVRLLCSSLKDHKRHHHHHHHHSELLPMAGDLRMASLSPESHASIWDTTGLSIKLDHLSMPSDSMDLSQFQKKLDDQYLWTSNSTFEDVSQSKMRISWREGLVSRIFEMDEFDSCRCLSDEEEDLNVIDQSLEIGSGNVVPTSRDGKEKLHSPLQCSYAESISTDGGGLAQSTDLDWNLWYKNSLFRA